MLSGEILNRSPLSVVLLPPPSLIDFCRTMAAIATLANQQNIDDDDIFLENGLLSYENPNYHMDPLRMERNSHLYEEIISELQQQGTLRPAGAVNLVRDPNQMLGSNRKGYLDIGTMGVDSKEVDGSPKHKQKLLDGSPNESETQKDEMSEKGEKTEEEIQHISGTLNAEDLYALPNKRKQEVGEVPPEDELDDDEEEEKGKHEDIEGIEDKDETKDLPPGWEKHEDNGGPYYWHIKSGTIQREPPVWPKEPPTKDNKTTIVPTPRCIQNSMFSQTLANLYGTPKPESSSASSSSGRLHDNISSVTRSSTSSALDQEDERRRREDIALKRRSFPLKSDSERPIRFAVRSLGWVEIAEEDLTPERSSKAVNKCIVDLSLGRNELLDVVGRWGDGKDLFMDLDEGALKLIDPETLTILNSQPIHTIRVWGVGRDNGRDFAYVARDRLTRIHMCHVFRCDTAARTIANTLRDICKRIMIERSLQLDTNSSSFSSSRCAIRPTDLPTENRRWIRHRETRCFYYVELLPTSTFFIAASFPTPMEEPKKVLKAQYLGSLEVNQPTGMDALNDAIDKVVAGSSVENWESVNVSVAPSMISVNTSDPEARLLCECRVRYLSFLGIGRNVKCCAFIMHTAQDKFLAHVFHCEPSSGALCKTIEAACKLRYQKCLDAHPEGSGRYSADSHTPGKGIGATLKNLMSSFSLKKDKASS
ncbi:protein Fe65 homolog isoform X2 [Topomyia yanbarensis]|uniref:protein Fe65 homolog isoform X2 n=1 Tax=Topomyia yanbarensis TaxID=2498891 RepID=UPI00273BB83B|nr:protein Fe65 homolog isoform X2 [Topomyia yanbarensis]XP_058829101.1 protein Fe65 homolog isoform X2 [Topomyia yanbarensis]XP_058829102.1 protein Fe65 homolog isoform X2 [Topomyia yanbarensis]XP_058829104.1 protein Fe65 homolog isoform X2 [Topomyia yanbarensis]XP_058829105.1 protein Fe65 homolog isoform X2 [Topomyia yanbarensis]XP_058829106.1 protein Fe65 homolog isoform X2 [Topomyia yanbarensis]XP_058829107.1 protein Fe65 homolog isoform X2 [Topomyia yanbarensis]XP_058829108.1 protein Fe